MPAKKNRGIITNHKTRYHNDKEIIPAKFIRQGGGRGIMVAQYKDTRDLVLDENGKPIAWNQA